MLKFQEIVVRKVLLSFSILFLALGLIVYFWIKDFYLQETKKSLLSDIKIIALNLQNNSNPDLLALQIKKNLKLRLTLIDIDGNIIAESHKDKTEMQNHKYREEIVEANSKEYGFQMRHSVTIDKDLLYVAKLYTINSKKIYIRLSQELKSIHEDLLFLGEEIFGILALFFIAIFFITYKMSQSLELEVKKIVNFLTALTKKNKETYIRSDYSVEFSNITTLLTKVSLILVKKEKQKSKFTAKLQSSNKQKDDIISAISHEFKNPIAVINGYSQTLLDDPDINPNIRQKFLKKIYKNGIKLSELIDTLRLSSKLDSGQQKMQFKTIRLYELVKDTVDNTKLHYPKREVIIQGEKDITLRGDASLFGVVLTNLIENAFKYSEDEVIVSFTEKYIEIVDSGIGISQKNLENITNKFYRVNENTWNNSLGLGLFIVSNILTLHKFKLKITSKENEGSTFKIMF